MRPLAKARLRLLRPEPTVTELAQAAALRVAAKVYGDRPPVQEYHGGVSEKGASSQENADDSGS